MKKLNLSCRYALVALDGLESLHPSMAKSAVIRAVAAARVLEEVTQNEDEYGLSFFTEKVNKAVEVAKHMEKKEEKETERDIAVLLETDGLMEEIPDILGCDMDYYTAGIELKAYRSEECTYTEITEGLRSKIMGDGSISMEDVILLWLLRESGCIHDLFSVAEQTKVQERMTELASENECLRFLWKAEFHSVAGNFVGRFLKVKHEIFRNPYLEGVNLLFPFMERRKAIFIDLVVLGTSVKDRRMAVIEHLTKMGHDVQEIRAGSETLLKVNRVYYRIFPMTKRAYKVPIQGVNLVPVYM